MRNILLLAVLLLISCSAPSQDKNIEITEGSSRPYLLGPIDKSGLSSENYSSWFLAGYDTYEPKSTVVAAISEELKAYKIKLFMATWCGDSRREVPRFYKILEEAQYPMNQLHTIALSRAPNLYKQSPNHEEQGLNIHRVPTFIFYKNGIEIGRIIEHPVASLEEDIASILEGSYTSNYHMVTILNKLIDRSNFYELAKDEIASNKSLVKSPYELNTYARVLKTNGKAEKALVVLELNTLLFPKNEAVFENLARAQLTHGNRTDALASYERAYEINPKNEKLKNNIIQLKSGLMSSNN